MSRKLTKAQERYIEEMVRDDLECGHPMDPWDDYTLRLFREDETLKSVAKKALDYYAELLSYGPAGFYEEFRDELEFSSGYVAEYGIYVNEDDEEEETDEK